MNKVSTTYPANYRAGMCFTGFCWLILAGLLIIAINFKDPHLLAYRQFETALLLIISICGIVYYLHKHYCIKQTIALSVLFATIILVLLGEFSFHYRKNLILNKIDETTKRIGEHFIVGYDKVDELRPLISKGLVAGIFITQHNVKGKSIENLRDEIREFQQLRKDSRLPPLIITTDQEGGIVSRLSPPLRSMPPIASILTDKDSKSELMVKAEAYGREQGQALADIGITVNFSPVVDLKSNRPESWLDFHSLISQRAISNNPVLTTEVTLAYILGMESQGLRGTLKHFPGLGHVVDDTHHFSAKLHASIADLDNSDWIPFKQLIKSTDALIMLSHVILAEVDSANPVSFSKTVVQTIIRDTWKYEGILITDDLTMGAAYSQGLCNATIKALNAGVDLLLISYDYEKFYEAMYCASRAYSNGQVDKAIMELSHHRLNP